MINQMNKTAVLTGAGGVIGSHMVDSLLEEGYKFEILR